VKKTKQKQEEGHFFLKQQNSTTEAKQGLPPIYLSSAGARKALRNAARICRATRAGAVPVILEEQKRV
jgi:hypothetical protein